MNIKNPVECLQHEINIIEKFISEVKIQMRRRPQCRIRYTNIINEAEEKKIVYLHAIEILTKS